MTPAGFPHSDTPGSQLGCQLPRAYRRLQRPSSALDAKASTMCPSQLVSQTLNKNNKRHNPTTPTIKEAAGHYKNNQTTTNHHPHQKTRGSTQLLSDARVHYPLLKHRSHQPPPRPQPDEPGKGGTEKPSPPHHRRGHGPDSSGPNSVPNTHPPDAGPRFHTNTLPGSRRTPAGRTKGPTPRQGAVRR